MKLKEIVSTYKLLGEAKVINLTEEEVLSIVVARKQMRKLAVEYDEYLKDVQDKLKPENFDELLAKAQLWETLNKEEQASISSLLKAYEKKINDMVKDELNRIIEIDIKPLSENCLAKLIKINGWTMNKTDELSAVL